MAATADDEGWTTIAAVGSHIGNQSSFDARNYGFNKLSKLIEATELFEVEKRKMQKGNSYVLYVRDKRFVDHS
ncbi:OST-HTH/LOTUS domain-containing protein [Endothiovibrio diazotrophicus]